MSTDAPSSSVDSKSDPVPFGARTVLIGPALFVLSWPLIYKCANDEPFIIPTASEFFLYVIVGTLLLVLWTLLSSFIIYQTVTRKWPWPWLINLLWGLVTVPYLIMVVVGYWLDTRGS